MNIASLIADYARQQDRQSVLRRFEDLPVLVPGYGIGITLGLELGAGIERAKVGVAIRNETHANDADGIRFSGSRYLAQPEEVLILDEAGFREAMAWGQPLIPNFATMVDRRRARDLHSLDRDRERDLGTFAGPLSPTQDPDELDADLLDLLAIALDGEDEVRIAMIVRLTMLSRSVERDTLQCMDMPEIFDV